MQFWLNCSLATLQSTNRGRPRRVTFTHSCVLVFLWDCVGEKMTCAPQRRISHAVLLVSAPVILAKHTSRTQQCVIGTPDAFKSLNGKASQSSAVQSTHSGKQYYEDILTLFPVRRNCKSKMLGGNSLLKKAMHSEQALPLFIYFWQTAHFYEHCRGNRLINPFKIIRILTNKPKF